MKVIFILIICFVTGYLSQAFKNVAIIEGGGERAVRQDL